MTPAVPVGVNVGKHKVSNHTGLLKEMWCTIYVQKVFLRNPLKHFVIGSLQFHQGAHHAVTIKHRENFLEVFVAFMNNQRQPEQEAKLPGRYLHRVNSTAFYSGLMAKYIILTRATNNDVQRNMLTYLLFRSFFTFSVTLGSFIIL